MICTCYTIKEKKKFLLGKKSYLYFRFFEKKSHLYLFVFGKKVVLTTFYFHAMVLMLEARTIVDPPFFCVHVRYNGGKFFFASLLLDKGRASSALP